MSLEQQPTIDDVARYWNDNPVHSVEFNDVNDWRGYFDRIDQLRWTDNERWAQKVFYDLKGDHRTKILDAGCGIGVFTRYYARKGFQVHAIDITPKAVELTRKSLEIYGLKADVKQGSVEKIPFEDNSFDYIVSNGVIHHTPETEKAVSEFHRVLKPGGIASVCIYYRAFFLRAPFWWITKSLLPLLLKNPHGREKALNVSTPEEFVKVYDGNDTPIAKMYPKKEADELFKAFKTISISLHYFPVRFLRFIPVGSWMHYLLDKNAGILIYYLLQK